MLPDTEVRLAEPEIPAAPDIPRLTRAMARGEEPAFREFFALYYSRLWAYLLVVAAGREALAQEALQRTFLRVAKHVRAFPAEEVFWSWLTVLARSALVDERRRETRYLAFLDRFFRRQAPAPTASSDTDSALLPLLENQLAQLPESERRLIEGKYYHRRTVAEIAADHATSEKAVESRLARIRLKLKQAVLASLSRETEV